MKVKWLSAVVGGQPHFNQDRTQSPAAYSGSHHPLARREDDSHELIGRKVTDDIVFSRFESASQEGPLSMKTIRSSDVAEAPPQTWSNMKVANGYSTSRG